jgi:hypothetical protein
MRISSQQSNLLKEVLLKRRPDLVALIDGRDVNLDEIQREAVAEAVVEEMLTNGLQGTGEKAFLSARGELLDDLAGLIRLSQ